MTAFSFDFGVFSDFDMSVIVNPDLCYFRKTDDGWKIAENDVLDSDFGLLTTEKDGRFMLVLTTNLTQGFGTTIAKADLMVKEGFNKLETIKYFFKNITNFQTNQYFKNEN